MDELSWAGVSGRRLTRQGLGDKPYDGGPAGVVRAMCGAHAQVMSAAELSIGLRLDGATRESVQAALWTDRELVKTTGPRGTVHLFATEDLPLWTGALGAVPRTSPFAADVQLDPEQTEAVVGAIGTALADAELTVDELGDAVVGLAGSWAGDLVMPAFQGMWPRWRQAIGTAAYAGALCFGANRGRNVTYTSPKRWSPGFEPADPATAVPEVVRSYLRAYGPATPDDFARWIGAPRAWAADQFAALGGELEQVTVVAGPGAWQLAGEEPGEPIEGVRLLPYFDAYAVAGQPRELLFPGRAWGRALARGQAGNFPVLLIDGVVAGVWHLRRTGRRSVVTVEPLSRLNAVRRKAVAEQVERIGAFFGGPAELVIGEVTVGPHA
jgi:hypothetical protein